MGEEIGQSQFTQQDFKLFQQHLQQETEQLANWVEAGHFADEPLRIGFELEAWLVDQQQMPAPKNVPFLDKLDDDQVVSELAKFNVEINGQPQWLTGNCFSVMANELQARWDICTTLATELSLQLAMIGILPTVGNQHLTLSNMSPMQRYTALNQQILAMRGNKSFQFDIQGQDDHLKLLKRNVMLESTATSFQIHLQVGLENAAHYYNLSKIISAPLVGVAANSPFLMGHNLWAESRIPVFEQSIDVGATEYGSRVTFGNRYVDQSLVECFQANQTFYPIMLPHIFDEGANTLAHLRLHNGTIWRWNRPLIGFSDSGQAHFRIENRVVPAGPTVADSIANAVFYYGLVKGLTTDLIEQIPFATAKANFYQAAEFGLDASLDWAGKTASLPTLILETLLPTAQAGLSQLGVAEQDSDYYLGIIHDRTQQHQNGAIWQRRFMQQATVDWQQLTQCYLAKQQSGQPVHTWETTC